MRSAIATGACVAAALILSACSGGPPLPSLSTGSLGGSTPAAGASGTAAAGGAASEAAATVKNDPTQRAFQVGATSARAVKCGFYFDQVRLKQQFLAAEATQGTADMVKVEKIYDVSFNGISRGIAEKQDYCSEAKTREVKEDLTRHLAGDYSPRPTKQVANKDEGGFFGSFFDNEEVQKGPKMGTDEWWEAQRNKAGGR